VPIGSRVASLFRTVFRSRRLDRDLDDEIGGYLEELTLRKVAAGMTREEARHAAVVEMGGRDQIKEAVRDRRVGHGLDSLLRDVRYALRGLHRAPGFAAVVVLTMAIGIGANTAIFSVVDGVLVRTPPFADLDRLVMVWETDRQTGTTREPASVPDYLDFKARATSFQTLSAIAAGEANLTPSRADPIRLAGLSVTWDLIPSLGVEPLAGRGFTADEGRPNGPRVALISASLWERVFAHDPHVIGKTLRLNDVPFGIVGVVPDAADFGVLQILTKAAYSRSFADRGDRVRVDVWLPLQPNPAALRDTHGIFMVGRLAAKASPAGAAKEMAAIAADLERMHPSNAARGVNLEPFEEVVFSGVRPALMVLLGAVLLVLVVASVNVANLLLARGTTRVGEVAMRAALGASTTQLARQFLIEGLVLTLASAAAGVLLAFVGLEVLVALAPPEIPRLSSVAIDRRVLGVTLGLSVLVGVAFGMVPLVQARRIDVSGALKGSLGRERTAGRQAGRVRAALVVAEVGLATLLVVGAGLLLTSFWRLTHVDAGFRAEGVLKAEYNLPGSRYPARMSEYPNFTEFHAFTRGLLERTRALAGVESAAIAGNHPLDAGFTNSFRIVGREGEARTQPEISIRRVTAGYFHAVGLGLARGRLLADSDATASAPVLVINEAAARRFFPRGDAIGARINFWGVDRTIVGIVRNERFHGLGEPPPIAVYSPLAQTPSVNGACVLLVKASGQPTALAPSVRRIIRDLDPGLAVFGIETLERTVSRSVSERRFSTLLLVTFASVALLLATIGIHGLLSYGVSERTREIGIRMALGARPGSVVRLILVRGLWLAGVGLALGLIAAVGLRQLLATLLFGVGPSDPSTLVTVALFLIVVAAGASYIPARRATKVDPIRALRSQ
jgi:predicted permease